jgi:[CysO sulfur-carrier protein]-thiocarboxylate-dependent cysteine synthase
MHADEARLRTTLFEAMLEPRLDNRPCGGKYGDIVEAIGNTPLVELKRLSPKPGVRIYAKLEYYNPTGSVKDRVARAMIERAEEEGLIGPGQTILEPTSGNTGISLAMICSRKGYPLKVVMPENVTEERTQLLRMYGADIVYSPAEQGSNGAVAMALEMAEADAAYYMPYQYGNPANPDAHYHGTAVEILEELDEVHAFVGGLGTGGTLMGNARRLKEEDPETLVVAAEPLQGENVQGLRSLEDGYIPPILDLSLLDRKIFVSNRDAVVWTKKLLEEEGLFIGVSSGAIASIAVRAAEKLDEGNVVFVAPDDGWKYLSSGVYSRPLEELEDAIESASFW